jgi:hypothetical protein
MEFRVRLLVLLTTFAGALAAADRTPVLLELFTSEGCSSCPPADRLLVKLHQEQPIRNVEVIVLSEHVDYWNRLGWFDRFSSPEMTKRQSWYSMRWPTRVYTPQAIVDGEEEIVGGDGPTIVQLIRQAARRHKGTIVVSFASNEGGFGFRLDAKGLEQAHSAKVMLAVVEDGLASDVASGENAGQTLTHAGVVRALVEAGSTKNGEAEWSGAATVPFGEGWNRERLRAVAFIQENDTRAVIAIGSRDLTE